MFFVKYSYRVGYIELQSWRLTLGNSINSDSTNSKNGDRLSGGTMHGSHQHDSAPLSAHTKPSTRWS